MQATAQRQEVQKTLSPYEMIVSNPDQFAAFLEKDKQELDSLLKGLNLGKSAAQR